MNRRDLLKAALLALLPRPAFAATVSTLIGNGSPGLSDSQVNNPYGLMIARDGGLFETAKNNASRGLVLLRAQARASNSRRPWRQPLYRS